MKRIISVIIIITISKCVSGQTIPERYADSVTTRMADSLFLKKSQADSIRKINLDYCQARIIVIKEYRGNPALPTELQKIEAKRDSLTEAVIGDEKYTRYRFHKMEMISNKGRR